MNLIFINSIFVFINRILNIIFPLLSYAYVSRILGVEQNGNYYYIKSIISYFVLAAGLGVQMYAIREGVLLKDNANKIKKFISEIFTINVISAVLSYASLMVLITVLDFSCGNRVLALIMSVEILCTTLGMEWIFQIYEDFRLITIRNFAVKVISLILILIFVKSTSDIYKYAFIMAFGTAGAGIFNFAYAHKKVHFSLIFNKCLLKHLKTIIVLFGVTIATDIYTNSDVTMLGMFTNTTQVGLYTTAIKIYSMVDALIASIVIASYPQVAKLLKENFEKALKIADNIWNTLFFILLPAISGIIILSEEIVVFVSGREYADAKYTLQILSVSLFFHAMNWFLTRYVTLPYELDRLMLNTTIISAVCNISLNLFLIPMFDCRGAAFTTIVAELIPCMVYGIKGRFYFKIINPINILETIAGTLIMSLLILCLKSYMSGNILLIMSVLLGIVIYLLAELAFGNKYFRWVIKYLRKREE